MSMTGQCLCGAITFTAEGVATGMHSCHCSTCRRWSGSSVLAASVDSIEFGGTEQISVYASSDWAERGFCSKCGSNLFYHLKEADHFIMSIGAFDDQSDFKLTGEMFVDEKPDGYSFAGDHPRLTGEEFMASMQEPKKD